MVAAGTSALAAATSPTLKRANRRIVMFSPSFAIAEFTISPMVTLSSLMKVLLVEAILLVELFHLAVHDALHDVSGLPVARACAYKFRVLSPAFPPLLPRAEHKRIERRDVHRDCRASSAGTLPCATKSDSQLISTSTPILSPA